MTENTPITVTDAQFEEEVLRAKGISLVDFWAPWCGPCHAMAPALDAFAKANAGKVKVFKLNVDDNPKTADKYEIRSIPTLIFFRDGNTEDISRKALSESELQAKLGALLAR